MKTAAIHCAARAQPEIIAGPLGAGSGAHLNVEDSVRRRLKIVNVGFKGQPEALIEIVAGRVHFTVMGLPPALPLIKDGRLMALRRPIRSARAVAGSSGTETPLAWRRTILMHSAPGRHAGAVVARISKDIARVLEMPNIRSASTRLVLHRLCRARATGHLMTRRYRGSQEVRRRTASRPNKSQCTRSRSTPAAYKLSARKISIKNTQIHLGVTSTALPTEAGIVHRHRDQTGLLVSVVDLGIGRGDSTTLSPGAETGPLSRSSTSVTSAFEDQRQSLERAFFCMYGCGALHL